MRLNGSVTVRDNSGNAIILENLNVILVDHQDKKVVFARLDPCPKPLILWRGAHYDEVGDYTQAQAEERIIELLGTDLQASLQELYRV